ncbi:MAG: surface antigen [Myxococcales bacterium]|nr:surface antigen [Myxococcales bacterium]
MYRRAWFLALAACGGQAPVQHPGDVHYDKLRIEGNHAIDGDTLEDGLALDRHRDIDEYQIDLDTKRLAALYQRLGYFSVEVHSRIEHQGDTGTVVFTIVEGRRATTHVEISGLPADVSPETARALVPLSEGAPFDYAAYALAKAPLLALVEDRGYAHARLEAGIVANRATATATATFVFEPGPPCTFGDITIGGTTGDLADAARARITFHKGDRYSSKVVALSQIELLGLGRFASVRIEPDRSGNQPVIAVKVSLTEGNRNELRIGGGLGLDPLNYSIRGRAQYSVAGFPGPLWNASADFKPALSFLRETCGPTLGGCQPDLLLRLIGLLTRQDLVRPYVKGEIEGGADYLPIEAYTLKAVRVRLGLSTPLGIQRLQLRVGWQLAAISFANLNSALLEPGTSIPTLLAHDLGLDRDERLGAFTQTLVIDLRDQPLAPRFGLYAELRLAEGSRYAGGAYQYVQVTPEVRGFLPLGPLVLAGRLRVGTITGDVPPSERYFGGGASSNRGFAERQLSPVATSTLDGHTVPVGGAGLIETGGELRAPLGKIKTYEIGTVAFLDGGDVTNSPSALSAPHLHWAVGLGLRWFLLPVGPIRLDVSYRLNRNGPGEPQPGCTWNWFLSVGEAY